MAKPAHKNSKSSQKREPKEFDEEVIEIDRVTKVVKGGRRLRFRATVVIGNRKGKVGIGIGKSNEVTGAIQKAIAKAKKNLKEIVIDETTIPHEVNFKFKSAKLRLLPASPGTGIIAGGTIRKVIELAGIKDILSKTIGTTNKVNNTRAAYEALQTLRETPAMAKRRSKKVKQEKAESEKAPKPSKEKKSAPKKESSKKSSTKKQ